MTPEQIKHVLEQHYLWLKGRGGEMANLKRANLERANLERANLGGAYLKRAYLERAYLGGAYLERANLGGAYLKRANLEGAYLERANLERANLGGANLEGAYLKRANLEGAYLPHFQICPQEGSFIAYKKTTRGVVKLLIPEGAKRTNSLVGRKCRANMVEVIGGEGVGGTGTNYEGITYNLGVIDCPDYDPDIRIECTKGIHFFMTEQEAQEWS